MLNELEQLIYNTHLRVTRRAVNKPYKIRKNFEDVDGTTILYTQRVARLLNKFKHINVQDYFQAPFKLYGGDEYFDMKFFSSPRAMKAYTLVLQQEINTDPDTDDVIQRVIKSLHHIKDFCKTNHLDINTYTDHVTDDMNTFLLHLKQRCVHWYVAIEIPKAVSIIRQQDPDIMKFMFGDQIFNNIQMYVNRFLASQRCKAVVKQGLQKIQTNLTNTNNQ